MTCGQGVTALKAAHLQGDCVTGQFSDTIANGILISWSYKGELSPSRAPYGSTIEMVPSTGHGPVPVPTTISQSDTYQDALVLLQAVGLTGKEAYTPSPSIPQGNVAALSPPAGTMVLYGSTVTVTVSSGPPTVKVPNVIGQSVSQATTTLQMPG